VVSNHPFHSISDITGAIPYRIALAGGWIDQPFVSRLNPQPPGSMVVVSIVPQFRFMERCGMASSTRYAAMQLWGKNLPARNPADLVRELYDQENNGKPEPSGSQDMIGLVYPGISRLDYDYKFADGIFPMHIESDMNPGIAQWLEKVLHVIPVIPRPEGYNPLVEKNLDRNWIQRLGQSGKDCFNAILSMDSYKLGASLNECMSCWQAILPRTISHPTITLDLLQILHYYQSLYDGAMYSGCGGGYLFVISEKYVPGPFGVKVRL
jgi:hypothetical protein